MDIRVPCLQDIDWNKGRLYLEQSKTGIPLILSLSVQVMNTITGQIVHKEQGKTYISYNLVKIQKKTIACTPFVEEIYGAGAKNIRTEIIKL